MVQTYLTILALKWYDNSQEKGNEVYGMNNLILFLNSFLSYLLLLVIMIALVVIACVIGVKLRKSKDARLLEEELLEKEETAES